ncbi:transposable element Tcb1 transposase [Trichonephila clavipes]|nr:transposable element Tcb1 transposase [Trichonephila clavipes]
MQITGNHQMARIVHHNDESLEVSEELGITQSVISRLWQRFQDDRVDVTAQVALELQCRMRTDIYIFGSYCQKKQTEHSIRPVSSALFSYRYDSFKADRVQTLRYIGLYARRLIRCVPLTATHCRLRLTWSREHAL